MAALLERPPQPVEATIRAARSVRTPPLPELPGTPVQEFNHLLRTMIIVEGHGMPCPSIFLPQQPVNPFGAHQHHYRTLLPHDPVILIPVRVLTAATSPMDLPQFLPKFFGFGVSGILELGLSFHYYIIAPVRSHGQDSASGVAAQVADFG
jgi:hypothetical protein